MTNELNWLLSKARKKIEYDDCISKEFVGKLPYRMVMNAILNNDWTSKCEGGQGKNAYWSVHKNEYPTKEYSIFYNTYTGIVKLVLNERK